MDNSFVLCTSPPNQVGSSCSSLCNTPDPVASQRTTSSRASTDHSGTDPPRLDSDERQRLVRGEPGEQRLKILLLYLEGLPLAFLRPRLVRGRIGRSLIQSLRCRGDDGWRGVAFEGGYSDLAPGPKAHLFAGQFTTTYALAYPPFDQRRGNLGIGSKKRD